MCMEVSYNIGIEREFFYRIIDSEIRIPSDESGAVRIKESVSSSDIDAHASEYIEHLVSDAVFIVIERV